MFKQTIATALIVSTVGLNVAQAAGPELDHSEGAIGFLSGAAAGALLGGPFGLVAGAAAGALLAEGYAERRELTAQLTEYQVQVKTLDSELTAARDENAALARERERLSRQLARLGQRAALETRLAMDVLFRTNSPSLTEDARAQIAQLGETLREFPNVRVRLEGHADRRGAAEANLKLAAARAETIRRILIDAGVAADRIETVALGAERARADRNDPDGLALDRRVSIQLWPQSELDDKALSGRM